MIFSSPRFFFFLAALLVILACVGNREAKKRLLAVASCFFYAAWDWRYLGLLLTISVIDYVAASRIQASESSRTRFRWLLLSIVSNLGILAYFKYCNFFIANVNLALGCVDRQIPALDILLPAGISFYTFKTMSYTIDVYRNHLKPCRSWLDYTTFITFFPELIAGPIVRASVFLPQLDRNIGPTRSRLAMGSSIFLVGLTKKMLIADRLATIADPVFASPDLYSSVSIWCGVLAYAFQIYCDFSGYSDMAIGIAKMIGYDLPENFNMPYLSGNITEFWHRWHMTLSSWLRDYLYISLGGNRKGTGRTYVNLMLTMLLGGLWHGANWNFVLWGGLHGAALAIHRFWQRRRLGRPMLGIWPGRFLTFGLVLLAWVPFRATSMGDTFTILGRMFGVHGQNAARWYPEWLLWCGILVVTGHVVGSYLQRMCAKDSADGTVNVPLRFFGATVERHPLCGVYVYADRVTVGGVYLLTCWVGLIFLFAPTKVSPFIYFQF